MSRRQRAVLSLRLIVGLAAVVLIAITVLGVGWVAERSARETLTTEIQSRLLLEARNLALLSADALLSEFPELTLYPVVCEMQEQRPELGLVLVVDHEGKIQGHADARMLGTDFQGLDGCQPITIDHALEAGERFLANADMLVATVPVKLAEDRGLGTAIVGLRRGWLHELVTKARTELVVVTAGLLALATIFAVILMSTLLRSIGILSHGLQRIGRGDLDTPIKLRDPTELGLLADTVDAMSAQLKAARDEARAKEQEIIDTQKEIIQTLGDIVESRSRETANHTLRVAQCAYRLARLAGLSEDEAELILLASPMHDVGKIAIPDNILNKPARLSPEEFDLIKTHTTIGFNLLRKSERRIMKAAAIIAHQHHERWDGSGYPRGMSGDEIHIYGRIVSIVDVFDALRSHRVYKGVMPMEEVLHEFQIARGTQFDPRLLDLFIDNLPDFVDIFERYAAPAPVVQGVPPTDLPRAA